MAAVINIQEEGAPPLQSHLQPMLEDVNRVDNQNNGTSVVLVQCHCGLLGADNGSDLKRSAFALPHRRAVPEASHTVGGLIPAEAMFYGDFAVYAMLYLYLQLMSITRKMCYHLLAYIEFACAHQHMVRRRHVSALLPLRAQPNYAREMGHNP
ncbi:uncharacterized protein FIBRA_04399 [Fibroporia radiculosa]|uniref:Uncharacterized protein n=1 Tax=Fibroporia radiculosa TaxID=599839 RepID=J4G7A8_9APHY|nr:uncharacterized protein FIBRA_04399 [Fibroporia radiculosa]CCM02308.1 predicted protein [Fibroporia radiculosa]